MGLQGQANVPVEVTLSGAECDVVFAGEDGREWRVPTFVSGDGSTRVRFAAPEPGHYTWHSDADESGEMEIAPYAGDNPLYRRGRLRVAQSKRTLEHADGTPFLWMGDTWWMGLTTRLDWPDGFKHLTADRVAKGFNLVQIVAGPLPDFDAETAAFDPQQANEAGWSWEPGWTAINPAYYDLADLKIAHLVESGIVPCIVGMWGYYLPFMGIENAKRHWRNLVARYGAYPVVWCLAGEARMPTYSHHSIAGAWDTEGSALAEGWTEVARYLRGIDPYPNLLTVHPTGMGNSRSMLLDESLIDLEMLQTGHSSYASLGPSVDMVMEAVSKQPRMPVLNSEVCYEGIMGASWQEVQRFLFWTSLTSGSAGHTYGAQGMWAMSSRDEPFTGTTMNWGDAFWQDAMHLPGSAHVALGKRFLEKYPWWQFETRAEPGFEKTGRVSTFAAGVPAKVWVFYLAAHCMEGRFMGVQGLQIGIEPGAHYRAFFFNPRTGAEISTGPVEPDEGGNWRVPQKPTMEDWVMVLEA